MKRTVLFLALVVLGVSALKTIHNRQQGEVCAEKLKHYAGTENDSLAILTALPQCGYLWTRFDSPEYQRHLQRQIDSLRHVVIRMIGKTNTDNLLIKMNNVH